MSTSGRRMEETAIALVERIPPLRWLAHRMARRQLRKRIRIDADYLRRTSVAAIRSHMATLGYPLDDLTDAELEDGVQRLARAVASFGVTAEQASRAFANVGAPKRTGR